MTKIHIVGEPTRATPRPQWRSLVESALKDLGGEASLTAIYAKVEELAPTITATRSHWKAKIRQIAQKVRSIENVERGVWRLRSPQALANDTAHDQEAA